MKEEDIKCELISNIELQIEDTLFYMPGEIIKGKVILNPKFEFKLKEQVLNLSLKLIQYEFWDYTNIEINELKNIYTTIIQKDNIKYELKKEEIYDHKDIENFSIIEKVEKNKKIVIPFQIKIDDKKILPTFQYENEKYILGIRHLLIAECEEYNSSNYTGLFIGKNKNIEFDEAKEIKQNYIVGLGSLEIKADFPKLSYSFGEEMNINININSNLHFKKITNINQTFYSNIKWKGYVKNSLLDKNIYNTKKFSYNENKYGLLDKLAIPFDVASGTIEGAFNGAMGGYGLGTVFGLTDLIADSSNNLFHFFVKCNNIYYDGLIGGLIGITIGGIIGCADKIQQQFDKIKDILNMNNNQKNMENNFKGKVLENEDKKFIIESLKKFVYFKDKKVIGFIKFAKNIMPTVDGYYFNCKYSMKIEVKIEGVTLNRKKYLKTHIDLYDSDEYITKMKYIFKST